MKQKRNAAIVLIATLAVVPIIMSGGCKKAAIPAAKLKTPTIAVDLAEKHNTPDGMVVDKNNNILLNVPNFSNQEFPAVIVRIDEKDQLTEIYTLPKHAETGRCAPLGIDIGPGNSLYIADNQGFLGREDNQSRLIRVFIDGDKPAGDQILVTGMMQANAVSCTSDSVYVTDTNMATIDGKTISGVWRFRYDEFRGRPIVVAPYDASKDEQDRHLVTTFVTEDENWWGTVGANGMAFGPDGTMYVCNFGEASIVKIKLDEGGEVLSQETLAKGDGMKSTDGLKVDPKTGDLYVADFIGNAVHKIDPKTGKVTTIAKNENNSGGVGGKLDKPSEVCIRGSKMYIANIDLTLDGNEHDKPHTISVIEMD